MLSINTNLSSLIAQGSMKSSTNKLNQAIERMTTGFKINHAKDNAANYSISTNMTTKIGAYNVAEDNAAMGLDLISTAEGTLSQIEDKLQRLRALAEQAANGTYGEQSLNAINAEANALVDEINRLYSTAEYNGISLLKPDLERGCLLTPDANGFLETVARRDITGLQSLAGADPNVMLASGTYVISSKEELLLLNELEDKDNISAGTEFVLGDDIDMSGETWDHMFLSDVIFDGNGHSITGLSLFLFHTLSNCTVKNLGISDSQMLFVGFAAFAENSTISNCFVKDSSIETDNSFVGNAGFIAHISGGTVDKCYADVDITGDYVAAGFVSMCDATSISNCYSSGSITTTTTTSGFVLVCLSASQFTNCSSYTSITSTSTDLDVFTSGFLGGGAADIENCYAASKLVSDTAPKTVWGISGDSDGDGNPETVRITDCLAEESLYSSVPLFIGDSSCLVQNNSQLGKRSKDIAFQVGINSAGISQINLSTGFALNDVTMLRGIGKSDKNYLSQIDDMLAKISEKQTHFGATSNRLESVLEEITIQRDNLVSSRSTIRDADIAEVSSHYIQQQILQQASATLLATANQSPSIALQLI